MKTVYIDEAGFAFIYDYGQVIGIKYHMIFPFLRRSTSPVIIKNDRGEAVGAMERYHSSKAEAGLNFIFDNFVNHVRVFDEKQNLAIDIQEINTVKTLIREKWHVHIGNDVFECIQKSRTRMNPQFRYTKKQDEIWIKKDFADRRIRFFLYEELIAEAAPHGFIPPKSNQVTIKILDSRYGIHELAALYYIFMLKNV
nr:hypothetical protein [Paenibacillus pinihumi]